MNRISLLLALAFSAASTALAQNKPPVANQVADYTAYNGVTRSIDLLQAFSDPDATNAVRFVTVLGNIDMILYGKEKPITVANFLRYVDEGRYFFPDKNTGALAPSVIHRSVFNETDKRPFVIQGGYFFGVVSPLNKTDWQAVSLDDVGQTLPKIANEPGVFSNTTGTVAMAKPGNDPNGATSQWFINLDNNGGAPYNLDTVNGGFAVFGRLVGDSLNVAFAINALPRYGFALNSGYVLDGLPLRNYTQTDYNAGKSVGVQNNLVTISSITQIPPMNFTASSSNPAVAEVSIASGQFLHVTPKTNGTAHITVTATDFDGASVSQGFNVTVTTAPGRLVNISTRLQVGSDQNVLIGGFIVRGSGSKRLMVRGIGPSLAASGIANALADPIIELHDNTGAIIASNDNWQTNTNKAAISDSSIAPSNALESAILTTVPANSTGLGYTVVLKSTGDKNGVGLVEVYDLDPGPGSTVLNISTRGRIEVGENVMIGGFFIGGTDSKKILVRAIGPSLSNAGVTDALKDPVLELHNAQGATIDSNDDWQTSSHKAEIQSSGVPPSNAKESATYDILAPGAYTAIVRGAGDLPTGVGLVEVYQLP